jgi:hypothetical protein
MPKNITSKNIPLCSGLKLLTPGNPKTVKGEKKGFVTFILHLAPHKLSGFNTCAKATAGCIASCLNLAGRGGMAAGKGRLTLGEVLSGKRSNSVQAARIRRTRMFFQDRAAFMSDLVSDIQRAKRFARKHNLTPVFRLNGTSDIRFESVPVDGAPNVFALFPHTQFYDYTKLPNRKNIPANYDLTFSLADGNESEAMLAIEHGMRVAAVFRTKALVGRYVDNGFTVGQIRVDVIHGDDSDLRFLEPGGVVVALYAKGPAKTDRSGFVRE